MRRNNVLKLAIGFASSRWPARSRRPTPIAPRCRHRAQVTPRRAGFAGVYGQLPPNRWSFSRPRIRSRAPR